VLKSRQCRKLQFLTDTAGFRQGAHNFNFVLKFFFNGGVLVPKFAFLDKNFSTRRFFELFRHVVDLPHSICTKKNKKIKASGAWAMFLIATVRDSYDSAVFSIVVKFVCLFAFYLFVTMITHEPLHLA